MRTAFNPIIYLITVHAEKKLPYKNELRQMKCLTVKHTLTITLACIRYGRKSINFAFFEKSFFCIKIIIISWQEHLSMEKSVCERNRLFNTNCLIYADRRLKQYMLRIERTHHSIIIVFVFIFASSFIWHLRHIEFYVLLQNQFTHHKTSSNFFRKRSFSLLFFYLLLFYWSKRRFL